jgi:hypothetical protein
MGSVIAVKNLVNSEVVGMNRRGQMEELVLFSLFIALILVAGFSITSFGGRFSNGSAEVNEVLSNVAFYQEYIIKESEIVGGQVIRNGGDLHGGFQRLTAERNLGISGLENYYGRVLRWEDVLFEVEDDKFVFVMKELNIDLENEGNRYKRTFVFQLEFDLQGELVSRKIL